MIKYDHSENFTETALDNGTSLAVEEFMVTVPPPPI